MSAGEVGGKKFFLWELEGKEKKGLRGIGLAGG